MNRDYSFNTFEEAKSDAERYCKRDGRTWIMKNGDGNYVIINPYSKEIESHYLKLGWIVESELTVQVHHEMYPAKYKKGGVK